MRLIDVSAIQSSLSAFNSDPTACCWRGDAAGSGQKSVNTRLKRLASGECTVARVAGCGIEPTTVKEIDC